MRVIDRIGVEIEGGFTPEIKSRLSLSNNWHNDGSVTIPEGYDYVKDIRLFHNGEAVTPAIEAIALHSLKDWIIDHYPIIQNESCGTHIHVSLIKGEDYDRLATKEFYNFFIARSTEWADKALSGEVLKEFKDRLSGDNKYCCPNFHPCAKHSEECEHDCEEHVNSGDRCITYDNCEHDCLDKEQQDLAVSDYNNRRRNWGRDSCLVLECSHECENEDESDECYNECEHEHDSDCFVQSSCRHECDELCEYRECQHEHEYDSDCSCEHTPEQQRYLTSKEDARYAHINYCEAYHGTMEIRLFPAFRTPELTNRCVDFVKELIEEYLTGSIQEPIITSSLAINDLHNQDQLQIQAPEDK